MKAYFDNVRKDVPENIHDIFLEKEGTAVITIVCTKVIFQQTLVVHALLQEEDRL